MKLALGCCLLVTFGLVSCGGTAGSSSVSGTDPAAIKAAPAGVSTLVFMDLELVRPDNLTTNSGFPSGITGTSTVVTFTNCKAANGGYINGTIDLAAVVGQTTTTFTETFHLTVTPTTVPLSGTPAWSWVYTGTQTVVVTPSASTAKVTPAVTATYTDNSVTPASVKIYQVTSTNGLTVNWSVPGAVTLAGDYKVAQGSVESVTVTLAPPLTWNTTCTYPVSGTLVLDLVSASLGNDSTTVVFGPACGEMTISGVSLTLGQ